MHKQIISTKQAPAAIGTYSQAVKIDNTVYLSGQIPLDPATMQVVTGNIGVHIAQVFDNLSAIAIAAGGSLANIVKLNIYLTDLANFVKVNQIMSLYFDEPYPARVAVGVKELPKEVAVEMDAIMVLD